MSYQVLARKWRPKNFSEVAGQAHVLKSLINALDNQRLHHAYLFTGTRGVGKTTLARILAKCLNCEEGVTSTPCDVCGSCTEINEGRFIDLMEVDAASRTKVEDTRELLENVQYTPTRGRYKVYLIDEVHMLSTHSFNALLKTLEEPPEHVKFLFATTDPQKLPITILSRCLQFNLKNLSPQLIVEYLISVLHKEAIEFEEDALWQIAAAAAGSMRDALTLVDQAISYCEGKIDNVGVLDMLGVPAQRQVYDLLNAMAQCDIAGVLTLINTMAEQTPDFNQMLDSLLSVLHRIAMAQVLPEGIDNSFGDRQQLQELAGKFSAEDVQLYYQFGVKGREDLRIAPEARAAFEMLVIRMLVFSPSYVPHDDSTPTQGDSKPVKVEASEAATDEAGAPASMLAEPVAEASLAVATSSAESLAQAEPVELKKKTELSAEAVSELVDATLSTTDSHPAVAEISQPSAVDETAIQAATQSNAEAAEETVEKIHEEPASSDTPKPSISELQSLNHAKWLEDYPNIQVNGIAANILANVELARASSNEIHFILDVAQSSVYNEDILPKISQILSDYFQCELQAFVEVSATTKETAAQLSQRLKDERHTEMVTDFEQDANVQELLQRFSGTLAKDSIAPLEKVITHNSERKIKSR